MSQLEKKEPNNFSLARPISNSKGQSLLEYVLILGMISALSMTFLMLANERIVNIWVNMINLISGAKIDASQLL